MQAKIQSVYDEGAIEATPLIGARGLSMLVDIDGQRTLFDTGRRGRYLAHNLDYMNIDPDSIDRVVISHGHVDHAGGLEGLLKGRTKPVDVYAPKTAFGSKQLIGFNGIHVSPELAEKVVFHIIEEWTELSEHLFVTGPIVYGDVSESFMVMNIKKGPVVFSGCSHCGVGPVLDVVADKLGIVPRSYFGGVHIGKKEEEKANLIAKEFLARSCTDLHLNHCTSPNGITQLRVNLGLKGVNDFYVGSTVEYEI